MSRTAAQGEMEIDRGSAMPPSVWLAGCTVLSVHTLLIAVSACNHKCMPHQCARTESFESRCRKRRRIEVKRVDPYADEMCRQGCAPMYVCTVQYRERSLVGRPCPLLLRHVLA